MKHHIYADNAATTKLDKDAFEAMLPWLREEYGNASQPYAFARRPREALIEARMRIAELNTMRFFMHAGYRKYCVHCGNGSCITKKIFIP